MFVCLSVSVFYLGFNITCRPINLLRLHIRHDALSHDTKVGNHATFYTPVFRRDVLWYGDVRPSVRLSVRVRGGKFFNFRLFIEFFIHEVNKTSKFWILVPYLYNTYQ